MTRHHSPAAFLAALMISAIFAGCSKDSPVEPARTTDQQYFQQVVSGNDGPTQDLLTSDVEALDESAEFNLKGELFSKQTVVAGTITPVKFGRRIEHVDRSIISPATMYGDTVAIVHTQSVITGQFVIKAMSAAGPVTISKPFTETLHRDLRFERVWDDEWNENENGDDDHDEDGDHDGEGHGKGHGHHGGDDGDGIMFSGGAFAWRLVAATIVSGGTTPPGPTIQSIDLISPADTFTVTNPDTYFMAVKKPWKHLMPAFKHLPVTLRVTLTSASPDTDIVTLHHLVSDEGLRKHQFALVTQAGGGGQFTRVYELTWISKPKILKKFAHLVVSALSHASVYDDDPLAYSSTIWGIPYLPGQ